jgi:hypothetical protein
VGLASVPSQRQTQYCQESVVHLVFSTIFVWRETVECLCCSQACNAHRPTVIAGSAEVWQFSTRLSWKHPAAPELKHCISGNIACVFAFHLLHGHVHGLLAQCARVSLSLSLGTADANLPELLYASNLLHLLLDQLCWHRLHSGSHNC